MSKLRKKIRSAARKGPDALIADLAGRLVGGYTSLEKDIHGIAGLLEQEDALTIERKKTSRLIGAARKAGEDPASHIARVSEISQGIKNLSDQVDEIVERIESAMDGPSAVAVEKPDRPAHLILVSSAAESQVHTLKHEPLTDIDTWQRFVATQPHATIYHDARWAELIKNTFGHTPYYVTCENEDGELSGVFPTIHMNSRLFGSFMVSLPYVNYGGPLSSSAAVEHMMMQHAAELAATMDCEYLEARDTHQRGDWLTKQHKVTMVLPLPDCDEALDKQLGSKLRAQVNRAARENLLFQFGGVELLDKYYKVFSTNMRDLGTPVYNKAFFRNILETFPEAANIGVVLHNNKPVAAGFLLGYRDKLEIPWASSLRRANPLGVNMYLYRNILRTAIEGGYQYFDFGRSSKDASTYKYKKQWGAIEHPLYWHYWMSSGDELPELNPNNPKFKLAVNVWRRLPVAIANRIGPQVVRNLP